MDDTPVLADATESLLGAMSAARAVLDEIRLHKERRRAVEDAPVGAPVRMCEAALDAARSLKFAAMVAGAQERVARRKADAAREVLYGGGVAPCLLPEIEPALESLVDACDAIAVLKNEAFEVAEGLREELGLRSVPDWMDARH
jgi:hypothetical protein